MSNLALVLWRQGKYEEAESMNRQILARREKVLGAEHLDTLTSMSNLALVLWRQGKYEEAESINRQTLARGEKLLGAEHPDTLMSMNNLALVLESQGKYKEAESMNRQTLASRKKVLGKEHPDTLTSMANLASTYRNQARLKEAEELEVRVAETRTKTLGDEHLDTLASKEILALTVQETEQLHPVLSESELGKDSVWSQELRNRNYTGSESDSDVSDVSSIWSKASSKYSALSTHSTPDITQKASEQLAAAIYNDLDLRALYKEGALKYEKTRLLRNSDKLLKRLFKSLRNIASSDHHLATIRILRDNRQRAIVNEILYTAINPSCTEDRNVMEHLRLRRADREFTLNRLLSSNTGAIPSFNEDTTTEVIETRKA
ncbi:hypothetical protein K432DRAFT_411225 [Lepidopterella palustris CBS 459.81]|uniref:Kinesin light chain n=1 Tax=Lepidopterella palustris CBS 459.81 TaxID=1314670 RepID=A0A8E2DWA2_9PEZI|nr:hypothetical protein K432DRAFT_411225 [Lepidopterella palustris CBS 459.81]